MPKQLQKQAHRKSVSCLAFNDTSFILLLHDNNFKKDTFDIVCDKTDTSEENMKTSLLQMSTLVPRGLKPLWKGHVDIYYKVPLTLSS